MAAIAEFIVPAEAFPLGRRFAPLSGVRVEFDTFVPSAGAALPYFWVSGGDPDRVREALDDGGVFRSVTLVETLDERRLFRAEWDPAVADLVAVVAETDVTLLSAVGDDEEWTFEVRGDEPGEISRFRDRCHERDVPVAVRRLTPLTGPAGADEYDLTPDQREALVLAYEAGYYARPREVDLESLAEDLNISRQSFAARLTRGYRNLIRNTLIASEP